MTCALYKIDPKTGERELLFTGSENGCYSRRAVHLIKFPDTVFEDYEIEDFGEDDDTDG